MQMPYLLRHCLMQVASSPLVERRPTMISTVLIARRTLLWRFPFDSLNFVLVIAERIESKDYI